ncbi:Hypothetical predicted protein [Mytilus galloprovincialis]|uniref:B box-type domain-containing protein n=1 Tax=Mytilus galloprovincialis TaxID=29158 RepID=A0A8B6F2T0_MYTGA|nr:Hypothetical predicted protein [Mytilus galloprovincialis]
MDSIELCQCCLRENEEEVAEQWCNECNEAVCRSCGKAHRRFVVAHDVVSIKNASSFRKKIPKSCRSHANKKLFLFCIGHDEFICHECLSGKHRKCNKIVEIETAAEGVRESAALTDLKERMIKFTSILEKTQIENEQQLSKISIEKESTSNHLKEFIKCFNEHIMQIENNLDQEYDKIVIRNKDNGEQLSYLKQSLQENMNWLCMLESNSSETNIFHAVKHLDTIQATSENQVGHIKKDLLTIPLDVLPPEGTKNLAKLFENMNEKARSKVISATTSSDDKCKQSQIKVKIRTSQSPLPRYQELTAGINSTLGAFCFTEDGRIVVEACVPSEIRPKLRIHCLRIFHLQSCETNQIELSEETSQGINFDAGSIAMVDNFALLVSKKSCNVITVIDTKLQRVCRTITLQHPKGLFHVTQLKRISCKGGQIFLFAVSNNGIWLFSIAFNGTILSEFELSDSIFDLDFDGVNRFFYTDRRANDIHCISNERGWNTSKCYSSLDLTVCCSVLHIDNDELLLLENNTSTVYKLDVRTQRRSIVIQGDIFNPAHFNLSFKFKKFAITMDNGKRIRIFPF